MPEANFTYNDLCQAVKKACDEEAKKPFRFIIRGHWTAVKQCMEDIDKQIRERSKEVLI